MKRVLSIAGSDPSGGAGIQADLRTFLAFNVRGLSAVTALTVQGAGRVEGVFPVPPSFVKKQIQTVAQTCTIDAVKIGMLATGEIVAVLAELVHTLNLTNVVLDPVITSSSGFPLLEREGVNVLRDILLARVLIVTPNLREASLLTGREVVTEEDMTEAAVRIREMGPRYVLVKGGHLKGKAVDVLYDGVEVRRFAAARLKGGIHGTGCILSAAIAACLAKGEGMEEAVGQAKQYVEGVIRSGGY